MPIDIDHPRWKRPHNAWDTLTLTGPTDGIPWEATIGATERRNQPAFWSHVISVRVGLAADREVGDFAEGWVQLKQKVDPPPPPVDLVAISREIDLAWRDVETTRAVISFIHGYEIKGPDLETITKHDRKMAVAIAAMVYNTFKARGRRTHRRFIEDLFNIGPTTAHELIKQAKRAGLITEEQA